jgi:hypothetical protein
MKKVMVISGVSIKQVIVISGVSMKKVMVISGVSIKQGIGCIELCLIASCKSAKYTFVVK